MIDLIKNARLVIDVARHQVLGPEWRTSRFPQRRSVIPYARLYFPVEGEGYISFSGKKLHLVPGKIYLIPPYVTTEVCCPERLVKYWVHFNAFMLDSELDIFNIGNPENELTANNSRAAADLFEILVQFHRVKATVRKTPLPPLEELRANSALSLLLMPFYESMLRSAKENPHYNTRFIKLLHYIEQHLSEKLDLQELSAVIHLNPTYLSNLFAEKMGLPLIQYCNNRRIARAIALLRNTDYSIEEIALLQGADNTATFSRLFKRHVGYTPGRYRQKLLRGELG